MLVEKFEQDRSYLPVLNSSDFSNLVDSALANQIMSHIDHTYNARQFPNAVFRALEKMEVPEIIVLHRTSAKSYDDLLFDPENTEVSHTVLTRDFIEYLGSSNALSPYAESQLKNRLRASSFNIDIELSELPEPTEDEILEAVLVGVMEVVEKNPKKFRDGVSTALLKKSLSANNISHTALMEMAKKALASPHTDS